MSLKAKGCAIKRQFLKYGPGCRSPLGFAVLSIHISILILEGFFFLVATALLL